MGRALRGGEWPPPPHLQYIGHGPRAVPKGRLSFSRTSGYDGGSGGGLPCFGGAAKRTARPKSCTASFAGSPWLGRSSSQNVRPPLSAKRATPPPHYESAMNRWPVSW